MGWINTLRQRMKDAAGQASEVNESARSQAAKDELVRLIDRYNQGLIGEQEYTARKAALLKGI